MREGYVNFQRVAAGELLANDARGEIRAPWNGMVLLPLYQQTCDRLGDGADGPVQI